MSETAVNAVISRALRDMNFLEALLDQPDDACEQFDLTPTELATLKKALGLSYHGRLQPRISKSTAGKFMGFTGPMGIDGIVE